jgi:hypothetical protein
MLRIGKELLIRDLRKEIKGESNE